jgi:ABC-type phosphate/phosphonate transport system substrate-binding protein
MPQTDGAMRTKLPLSAMLAIAALATAAFKATVPARADPPLRVVVAAEGEGLRVAGFWSDLGASEDGGSGFLLEIVPGNRDVEAMLRSRTAEAAVLDPVAFLEYGAGLTVVAVLNHYGKSALRFSLIVPNVSIYHRIYDLDAPRIAFRGPFSGIARIAPLAWARAAGAFAASHGMPRGELLLDSYESVLRAVALGEADAGFVPSGLLDGNAGSILLEQVRELGSTPPVPIALLVVRSDLPPGRTGQAFVLAGRGGDKEGQAPFTTPDATLRAQLDAIKEAIHDVTR